jgi:inorganic triphosphatase YgiF
MDAMKALAAKPRTQEIELKLALLQAGATDPVQQLAQLPMLLRHKARELQLHNVYYDTPDQRLRQQRVVLRLRRVGPESAPQWLQTMKTSGVGNSALSQRGEWELPVAGAALSWQALRDTPWQGIDPDGSIFAALVPCFVTHFERTFWCLRRRDGSVVELALDRGLIIAGERQAPIFELELELLAGQPGALFDVAQQIARSLALLPLHQSKAQRGFALAQNAVDAPPLVQPLTPHLSRSEAAGQVLRAMFAQFSTHLLALCVADDPEGVHQARVAWRRFRSALRLFRPVLAAQTLPSTQALVTTLQALGAQRDLDVARTEMLPAWADAYVAGDPQRARAWQAMDLALRQAATRQLQALREAVAQPEVGAALLAFTEWLEGLGAITIPVEAPVEKSASLRHWARRRVRRLHRQLRDALQLAIDSEGQHRARIRAKHMRYGIDALRALLPARRTQAWYRQAQAWQALLGSRRDLQQAALLVATLRAPEGPVAFLRGVAAAQRGLKD